MSGRRDADSPAPAGSRRWVFLVEAFAWWAVLFAGYLLLISTVDVAELVAGALIAACGAAAAVAARRASRSHYRPWVGLRLLVLVPGAVLADTALLVKVLITEIRRRGEPTGRVRTIPIASPADQAASNTFTAVAAGAMSMSPGSYVIDTRRESLLVHSLREQPDRLERAVRR